MCASAPRFSERDEGHAQPFLLFSLHFLSEKSVISPQRALADVERHMPAKPRQQTTHVSRGDGDASFGRSIVRAGAVQKNRAAQVLSPRCDIVVEHDDNIVERISPPHFFMREAKGQPNQAIVGRRARIVAPSVVAADRPARQTAGQGARTICADMNAQQTKETDRRRPVAFPLQRAKAGPPQRATNRRRPGDQDAGRRAGRARANDQMAQEQRRCAHGLRHDSTTNIPIAGPLRRPREFSTLRWSPPDGNISSRRREGFL